jgi:putative ATP-binding cassette transporter
MRVMTFRETLLTFEDKLSGGEHIEYAEHGTGKLALENIALKASGEKAKFDTDRLDIAPGERLLVVDKTAGRTPLLPAIAGQWPWGSGKLHRPAGDDVMFLTPQPYFPKGSLRAALAYPADPSTVSESDAAAALERVGLGRLSRQLERTARWWRKLTGEDQARLALARLLVHKPRWVLCEGLTDAIATDYRDLLTSIFEHELADSALISTSRRGTEGPLCKRIVHLMSGEEAAAPAQLSSGGLPHPAET